MNLKEAIFDTLKEIKGMINRGLIIGAFKAIVLAMLGVIIPFVLFFHIFIAIFGIFASILDVLLCSVPFSLFLTGWVIFSIQVLEKWDISVGAEQKKEGV